MSKSFKIQTSSQAGLLQEDLLVVPFTIGITTIKKKRCRASDHPPHPPHGHMLSGPVMPPHMTKGSVHLSLLVNVLTSDSKRFGEIPNGTHSYLIAVAYLLFCCIITGTQVVVDEKSFSQNSHSRMQFG